MGSSTAEWSPLRRQLNVPVSEPSQVGQVRRAAAALAASMDLDENERGKLAIVATEIAGNIIKHAGRGEVLLRALVGDPPGVEMLALDAGPGMPDLARCLQDGYSTAGSPGTGMGAIRRLSTQSDIYTAPERGTVLMTRNWARGFVPPREHQLGAVCLALRGEPVPGDAWCVDAGERRLLATVVDGLGHGPAAAVAAEEAMRQFHAHRLESPERIMQAAHEALHSTRGATMAVAELHPREGVLNYIGIGNISAAMVSGPNSRSMVSLNGTVGHSVRKLQSFSYPLPPGGLLVMHSDGLATRWNLADYPGLLARHPAVIAGVLYRDFSRQKDDVTVLAVRLK